jgi:hypothetical protein
MLQPEGISNSLILLILQPEGGYNPLSFLFPVTLKYKCRLTVTTKIIATVTATVTSTTITTTCPTNHCLIHETKSSCIYVQLMPRSPRAYLKPYAQQHQHMPLPSMYQYDHIPSQDMCLNQVPTYTMYQQCIDMYHNKCIYHVPTIVPNHASTMHLNLYQTVNQPCTSTPYHVPTMHINLLPQHHMPMNQYMSQQCISLSRPQPTCTMHLIMCLES